MIKSVFEEVIEHIRQNLSDVCSMEKAGQNILSQFPSEASHIENLISRTLTLGESNSALIIAPRGGGKSTVLQAVLNKLTEEDILKLGIVIKLSGLLTMNDRLALQEITRQMNLDEEHALKFSSFAENLSYILKTLQSGTKDVSMPLIFILDEFDLFCHHQNQTLLYNLFDICQSAQTPICVLGLTCRLDVIELLEKRVKSRFSHRQILLFPPDNFEQYIENAKDFLKVSLKNKKAANDWNAHINTAFKDKKILDIMEKRFFVSRNMKKLKLFLTIAVTRLTVDNYRITADVLQKAVDFVSQDSRIISMEGLSVLQLSLLISMKHILKIYDGEPFNFEMVYRQYKKFVDRYSSISSFEKPVCFKAFDQLECLELIRPIDNNKSSAMREYCLYKLMVLPSQIEDAISKIPSLPTYLSHWCSSDL